MALFRRVVSVSFCCGLLLLAAPPTTIAATYDDERNDEAENHGVEASTPLKASAGDSAITRRMMTGWSSRRRANGQEREEARTSTTPVSSSSNPRIVGGSDAALGEFPYFVGPAAGDSLCGATLVAPDMIVQARHCGTFSRNAIVGAYRPFETGNGATLVNVTQTIEHPDGLDVRMRRFTPVLSLAQFLRINRYHRFPASRGARVVSIGFGSRGASGNPTVLQKADMVTDGVDGNCGRNNLCARGFDPASFTYFGDSGSPLIDFDSTSEPQLVGIAVVVAGYGNVARISDWMTQVICENSAAPPSYLCAPTLSPSPTIVRSPTTQCQPEGDRCFFDCCPGLFCNGNSILHQTWRCESCSWPTTSPQSCAPTLSPTISTSPTPQQCLPRDSLCGSTEECCPGLFCSGPGVSGIGTSRCRSCAKTNRSCRTASQCCNNLMCTTEFNMMMKTGFCFRCLRSNQQCSQTSQCCSKGVCTGMGHGMKVCKRCAATKDLCASNQECCNGKLCLNGRCEKPAV